MMIYSSLKFKKKIGPECFLNSFNLIRRNANLLFKVIQSHKFSLIDKLFSNIISLNSNNITCKAGDFY